MATKEFYIDSLTNTVNNSNNINHLIKLLNLIPFVNIQSFIKQQIQMFDLCQSINAYYTITSINNIFPSDITQHILSFNESKDVNSLFDGEIIFVYN